MARDDKMRLGKFVTAILPLLLLAGPFLICWNPLYTFIPFDSQHHTYTPLNLSWISWTWEYSYLFIAGSRL